MDDNGITFIVNGNTYHLHAEDGSAIRSINEQDRQQLMKLLESVKEQDQLSKMRVQQVAEQLKSQTQNLAAKTINPIKNTTRQSSVGNDNESVDTASSNLRMSGSEVNDLMARLILEEKNSKKPGITKKSLYKTIGLVTVAIIILIIIF